MFKRKKKKQQDAIELQKSLSEEKNIPLFDITIVMTEPFPTLFVTNKRNAPISVFKLLIRDEQCIPYQVVWLSHLLPYQEKSLLLHHPIEEKEKAEVLLTWSVDNEEKSLSFPLKDVLVFPEGTPEIGSFQESSVPVVTPETTEPETTEPETIEPETIEPKTIEPKTIEPKTIEPKIVEPKTVEPETVEPETVEPETVEPETVEPETVEPETVEPEIVEPEINTSSQRYIPSWYKNHKEHKVVADEKVESSSGPFIPHWYKKKSIQVEKEKPVLNQLEQENMVKNKENTTSIASEKDEKNATFDIFDEVIKSSYEHHFAIEQESSKEFQDMAVEDSLEEDTIESEEVSLDDKVKKNNEIHVDSLHALSDIPQHPQVEDKEIQADTFQKAGDYEIQSNDLLSQTPRGQLNNRQSESVVPLGQDALIQEEKKKKDEIIDDDSKSVHAFENKFQQQNGHKISIEESMTHPNIEEIEDEIESEFKNFKN